jgi:chromosome segregation ATPase
VSPLTAQQSLRDHQLRRELAHREAEIRRLEGDAQMYGLRIDRIGREVDEIESEMAVLQAQLREIETETDHA